MAEKKILLIDDDKDVLQVLNIRLKSPGYLVAVDGDAITAVSAARKEKPDCAHSDHRRERARCRSHERSRAQRRSRRVFSETHQNQGFFGHRSEGSGTNRGSAGRMNAPRVDSSLSCRTQVQGQLKRYNYGEDSDRRR